MLLSVLGTGYLGATHAACLASLGHDVVGVDTDPARVAALRAGRAPFHEEGLDALLADGVASGRLRFTDDVAEAAGARVHFVCVGTPQAAEGLGTDLGALWAVVDALAPLLDAEALVVGKSTVPVGTAARVRDRLRATAPAAGRVAVAWNPEFLREGHAVQDSLRPDRLVLGLADEPGADADHALLREVYAEPIAAGVPAYRTDLETAELAKVSANALLAARVSLVNLLAEVCEAAGADVGALTEVLGADPRIGSRFLSPGLGYGGGCLPKDTRAFVARARELGVDGSTDLLVAVDEVNRRQRDRTVRWALRLLGAPVGARAEPAGDASRGHVAVLGGAFKAGSDDVRDSPAVEVAARLLDAGAALRVHDPQAGAHLRRVLPGAEVVDDPADALAGAGLVLVLTEWPEFAALDPVAVAGVVARPVVLDARLVLDHAKWEAAGWEVHALGRPAPARRTASGVLLSEVLP